MTTSGLPGCASGPRAARPVVEATAAEQAAITGGASTGVLAGPAGELDFVDALAARPLACHDDVLHGALLLGNGVSGDSYSQRLLLAKRLGYIDQSFNRPAREAATLGEVSRVMLNAAGPGAARAAPSQEQALARWTARGLFPAGGKVKAYQGITGAQLVTVLAGVREGIDAAGRPMLTMAQLSPAPTPAEPVLPATPLSTARLASAEDGPGAAPAAGEPLPAAATDPVIEQHIESRPPSPPTQPAAQPPRPLTTREWVPGKPLRRPG